MINQTYKQLSELKAMYRIEQQAQLKQAYDAKKAAKALKQYKAKALINTRLRS
jgi:hypothetical protein